MDSQATARVANFLAVLRGANQSALQFRFVSGRTVAQAQATSWSQLIRFQIRVQTLNGIDSNHSGTTVAYEVLPSLEDGRQSNLAFPFWTVLLRVFLTKSDICHADFWGRSRIPNKKYK